MVTPKSDYTVSGGGVMTQQNSVDLKLESRVNGIEDITQNSKVWINKTPKAISLGDDFTHVITSRDTTTNRWFITIGCRSAKENFPVL